MSKTLFSKPSGQNLFWIKNPYNNKIAEFIASSDYKTAHQTIGIVADLFIQQQNQIDDIQHQLENIKYDYDQKIIDLESQINILNKEKLDHQNQINILKKQNTTQQNQINDHANRLSFLELDSKSKDISHQDLIIKVNNLESTVNDLKIKLEESDNSFEELLKIIDTDFENLEKKLEESIQKKSVRFID